MPIQFGLFDHIEIHGGRPIKEVYEERIALLKRAEEGGFYAFHLAEHHGHDYSVAPSQPVFLSALARETTTLKLIPTVVCLPLHHPVRIFEELAMLDVLSDGRLEIGVGKGITPFEHLFFGHAPDEASDRAKDILDMLLTGWETGIMSSENSKFYDFIEFQLPWTADPASVPAAVDGRQRRDRRSRWPQLHLPRAGPGGDEGPLRRAARREPRGAGPPEPARHRALDRAEPGPRHRRDGRGGRADRPAGLGGLQGEAHEGTRGHLAAPADGGAGARQPAGQEDARDGPVRGADGGRGESRDGPRLLRRAGAARESRTTSSS